jgi:histidine triad (HIT) family protein
MADCLFCRIASGDIPAKLLFQDEAVVAFADITPQAPLHVLIIPRRHIASLNELTPADDDLTGRLVRTAASLAKDHGYGPRGYRTVFNCNADAGQTVFHVHLHLLAGRSLGWPPG